MFQKDNTETNPEPNPGNADPSPTRDHLPYTESRDQGDEQANPDPNPSPQPLVSLSPSSRALIKPIEVDNGEKCAAAPCRIQHFRGKNVQVNS